MADQDNEASIQDLVTQMSLSYQKSIGRPQKWLIFIGQTLSSILFFTIGFSIFYTTKLIDFLAFYGAGLNIRSFESPYGSYVTGVGISVFQSFPWLAWLFVPLTLFPVSLAFRIYFFINVGLLLLVFVLLWKVEKITLSPINYIYIFACGLAISYYCLGFGQVTIIQLAALTIMMVALQRGHDTLAGALFPLILIKPHLIIWLLFCLLLLGRWRFIICGIVSTVLVSIAGLIFQPGWPMEMITTFINGQAKSTMESWKFMTFPGLLSLPPIYGLLVLPLSIPGLLWLRGRIKPFPFSTQFAIWLAFSLATSPYAFAYDLPLLFPALIWLSRPWSLFTALIWFAFAATVTLTGFSGGTYLIAIATCVLIVVRIQKADRATESA